jgi:hypothetical protein
LSALMIGLLGCDPSAPGTGSGGAGSVALPAPVSAPSSGAVTPESPQDDGLSAMMAGAPKAGQVVAAPAAPAPPPASTEALQVVVATPTQLVRGPVRPAITFSRPVRALGRQGPDTAPPASIAPAVDGRWRWLGSTTVTFEPAEPLPLATAFTVTVPAGLTALDGAQLKAPYTYSFETPALRPINGEPVNGWQTYRWASPEQVFKVVFDQAPAPGALADGVRIVGGVRPLGVKVLGVRALAEAPKPGGPPRPELVRDRRVEVTLQSSQPLALNTAYQLVFPAGLASAAGPRTQAKRVAWGFNTYGPLKVAALECERWQQPCAQGPMTLRLSTPVRAAALRAALTIEPAVAVRWPADEQALSDRWTLSGSFKPDTTYWVRVEGLIDRFGQRQAPFKGRFKTGDMPTDIDVVENTALLEKGLRAALPVRHVNAPTVNLGMAGLTDAEVVAYLETPWRKALPQAMQWREWTLPGSKNTRQRTPLELEGALGATTNAALVRLNWMEGRYKRSTSTLVQVTDLAVHGKISPTHIAVWVWRLSKGTSVADAAVDLLDVSGKVVATARTDATGVAQFAGVDALVLPNKSGHRLYGPPFVAARVRHDADVAWANLRGDYRLGPYRFGLDGDWANTPPKAEGFVFTDRGIYRPGDVIHVRGVLRERSLGALRVAEGRAVKVWLEDAKGTKSAVVQQSISAFGGLNAQFTVPADGRLGRYDVQVEDPSTKLRWSTDVRVAEYRAPAFLVEVNGPAAGVVGAPVEATVEGRYLFGAAMSGAELSWAVFAQRASFTPPEAEAFVFGRQRSSWNDPGLEETIIARGTWQLDKSGRHGIKAEVPKGPSDAPRRFTVEANVTDVDRQAGAGRAAFLMHPAAFYVGLRGPEGFATAGQPFDVALVGRAATAKAPRVAVPKAQVQLLAQQWNTVRKKNASGGFETVSEQEEVVIDTCERAITADATATCSLVPKTAGYYEVRVEARDAKGRLTVTQAPVWVQGPGYAAWARDDDNQVTLVADKAVYDVGDTARLLVQSPYAEAEAWITVEREGVLSQRRVRLEGTATPIEVPIEASMIPNVFVSVVLAQGRIKPPGDAGDPGRPSFRVGYQTLKVVPDAKRLTVAVKPDVAEKFPGDPLEVAVAVTDVAGVGVRSEVTVWAVDEGVLALTGYEAPNPVALFHRARGLSVRNSANLTGLVAQLTYGEKGSEQGGGGGEEAAAQADPGVRSRMVSTPLFVGSVVTDAQGEATVRGTLPDNLTTFRLMAVAVTEGDRGGRGQSKVVVNKPLLARPAMPRSVREGDTFSAGVVVHRTAGEPTPVTVRATVQGGVEALGSLVREITVPADRGVEVRFAFAARAVGEAKLQFTVEGGGHRDAVERMLPVRRPVPLETMAIYGQADQTPRVEALTLPDGVRDDVGQMTVHLASSALAGLANDAEALIDYPYGCLEQQASRLIPLVALKSMLEQKGVAWMGDRTPKAVVAKAVAAMAAMQRPDGGFGYWPGARHSHFWATAHAVLALHGAQGAGYALGGVDLAQAIGYLRKHLDRAGQQARGLNAQAFGLWVLARVGRPDAEIERRVFKARASLALFGQAMLAAALGRPGGPKARAKTVLAELLNHAQIEADRVQFAEVDGATYAPLFSSDTRTSAMALIALLAVDPDHAFVPRVVAHLLDVRRGTGGYRTTQEGAYSLLALGDYARIHESATPDFVAQVRLGQAALVSQAFKGRSLGATSHTVAPGALAAQAGTQRLSFAAEGTGRLYYSAQLQYAPKAVPEAAADRGIVVQRWYRPAEGGAQGAVQAVTEGALVRVHLRVATHQARHYVVVNDPLPAGLEAVDPRLKTNARAPAPQPDGEGDARGRGRWARVFDHTELRDDRVLLFADHLPPGVHTYSYLARATTAGVFTRAPATAEEMYRPEVSGRSTGGRFWVHPRAELSQNTP